MSDATPTAQPAPTPNYSNAPTFDAGGGPNLKIILFALVVLIPIAMVGYVYWSSASAGGIRELPDGYKLVDLKAMGDVLWAVDLGGIFRLANGTWTLTEMEDLA